jgi:flagellar biosynthesis/type III secretory pathway protein FliH
MHAPLLQQLVGGVQTGEVDPVQSLPLIQAVYQHCVEHTNYLAADPSAKAEVSSMKQLLQIAEEVITNFTRKIQAEQRKAMEAGMAEGGQEGQQGPTQAELKMQEHQMKMQIAQQKAEMEMRIKQAKADQELALKDAERALKLSGNTTQ